MTDLSPEEQNQLKKLARDALEHWVLHREKKIQKSDLPNFKEKAGAFVTVKRKGQLRGCLGRLEAELPLEEVVQKMAMAAVSRDPRFNPVQKEELSELEIEISILSPFRPIHDLEEIEVGRDGLMVSYQGQNGLLLPQVATEYEWDVETFLRHTCMKGGLDPDMWREKEVLIEAFRAQII